ncbi:WD40 repeat domain-containing protein [Oleiharenicola lentus]|uniref:WD40 repeat domain-containing protein n=1 Tax=Oleiharenicola lentus TaxID=2508720 RepID=A0A4Q1C8D9_9BACT|nr:PD40 domain-containing protein [Oleiharenicola lentus]RXK55120.1 WD40 repeat domain-containing protein [Oleiharenicola lentus]
MQFAKHWAAALDDYAIDLAWSPDGLLLAAAAQSGSVTLFDATTGAEKHTLAGHTDGTNCLGWSPDGTLLATGGQDGCVRLWSPATGAQTAEAKLGNAWVEHLTWQSSGAQPSALSTPLLFAAAGRKLVAIKPDGTIAHAFPDAPKTISALAMKPGGATLAAACFGHVALWKTSDFSAFKEFPYGNAIYALTWSPDGRWLVAGCHDNAVHLWAPAEADLELHMSGYETRLKELSFSSDSKWLATGGGRDACVWDCSGAGPEGREPLLLPHDARVCALAFQHSHSLLASGSAKGEFTLWMPTRKNPMVAEVTMPSAATRFAWRGDDALLAVGTEKGQVFVFKTA